jgi:hypothetical protein
MRHSLIGRDDFVEGVRNLSGKPGMIAGQTYRKVSQPHRLQRVEQLMLIGGAIEVPVAVSARLGLCD